MLWNSEWNQTSTETHKNEAGKQLNSDKQKTENYTIRKWRK